MTFNEMVYALIEGLSDVRAIKRKIENKKKKQTQPLVYTLFN